MNQAYNNDKLIEAGQPVDEQYDAPNDKVLVWPDLVYVELITIVFFLPLCSYGPSDCLPL